MIRGYADFCRELAETGFTVSGGDSGEGTLSILTPPFCDPSVVKWHTGDPDTDPWEWRVRVLDERDDIAYGKLFFRRAGYITREWYPYFLAARRRGRSFAEAYAGGLSSHYSKRIFETLSEHGALPVHLLKSLAGFGREEKARFEKALTDLQMGLFVTMCGRAHKRGKTGKEYGWASTVFCAAEEFWPRGLFEKAASISAADAEAAIRARVLKVNPAADEKKIQKLIYG